MKENKFLKSLLASLLAFSAVASSATPVFAEDTAAEPEEAVLEEAPAEAEELPAEELPAEELPAEEETVEDQAVEEEKTVSFYQELDDVTVSAEAAANVFPAGTVMTVKKVDDEATLALAAQAVGENATTKVAVDITFICGNDEIQPNGEVRVTINSPEIAELENPVLVHVDDKQEEVTPEVVEQIEEPTPAEEVTADLDSFSVYAVVDEGQPGDTARAVVNFYGKDTTKPVATFYVKNDDLKDENKAKFEQIVYDPGVDGLAAGDVFKGWSISSKGTTDGLGYTVETEGKDIEGVRTFLKSLYPNIAEGDTYNIYAMIFKAYNIQFKDEDNAMIYGETLLNKEGEAVSYTIKTDYTPKLEVEQFQGWFATSPVTDGITPAQTVYNFDDTVYIKGDVIFTPNAPKGNWLVFDDNLGADTQNKASYTPPQFIEREHLATKPSNPERVGYEFGGWYTEPECTHLFDFDNTIIDKRTTLYAKWTVVDSASYTVIIWKQNVALDGYDFEEAFNLQGTPDTTISTITGSGDTATITGRPGGNIVRYTGFTFGSVDQNVTIKANGTSVINVYFDRKQYTMTFQVSTNNRWRTIKTITAYYEQDISSNFPIVGTNGNSYDGYVWYAQNSSIYGSGSIWVPYIDVMREEDTTFHGDRMGTASTRHYRYYTEVLPGAAYDVQFDGKFFELHADVGIDCSRYGIYATYEEDFSTMDAFSRYKSNPELSPGGQVQVPSTGFNFYYTRNKYPITYQDGVYVDGEGIATEQSSRGTLKTMPESDYIYYQASMSDYEDYFEPTFDGYVFVGWYLDESCTQPIDWNSAMPKGGIQVYAKWVATQYRVFLHANVDSGDKSLDWGGQSMSFRVDEGEKIAGGNKINGTRDEYELVGWYTDSACTNPYNFEAYTVNSGLPYLVDYDRTEPTELDDYSQPKSNENKDATNNRIWITKKFELYAKWRSNMKGARGIQVIYDAADGVNSANKQKEYTDPLYYLDQAKAIAQPASTPTDDTLHFVDWIVQKWDGKKWVNTDVKVSPGDSYEVLKNNAKKDENPEWDEVTENEQYLYTLKLVAQYGPKDTPTPTHIYWYSNFLDDANQHNYKKENTIPGKEGTHEFFQINEAVDIKPADTFKRDGYIFLGWAKVDAPADEAHAPVQNLTEANLFLKWENDKWYAHVNPKDLTSDWFELKSKKVAADEIMPYQDMYAVWVKVFKIDHSSSDKDKDVDTYTTSGYKVENGQKTNNVGDIVKTDADGKPILDHNGVATFDLTQAVRTGYFYGGYYSARPDKAYLNGAYVDSAANEKWDYTKAFTASGMRLKPSNSVDVYYLKEVDVKYLMPYTQYVYNTRYDNVVSGLYMVTALDDNNYDAIGTFVYADVVESGEPNYTEVKYDKFCKSFKLTGTNSVGTAINVDLNTGTVAGEGSKGYVAVWNLQKIAALFGQFSTKTKGLYSGKLLKIAPYVQTPDGIEVRQAYREFTTKDDGGVREGYTYKDNIINKANIKSVKYSTIHYTEKNS